MIIMIAFISICANSLVMSSLYWLSLKNLEVHLPIRMHNTHKSRPKE